MENQRVDSSKLHESTLAGNAADYIDENGVDDSSTMEEIDSKISTVEQLKVFYRWLCSELENTLQDGYAEVYKEVYEKNANNEKLH